MKKMYIFIIITLIISFIYSGCTPAGVELGLQGQWKANLYISNLYVNGKEVHNLDITITLKIDVFDSGNIDIEGTYIYYDDFLGEWSTDDISEFGDITITKADSIKKELTMKISIDMIDFTVNKTKTFKYEYNNWDGTLLIKNFYLAMELFWLEEMLELEKDIKFKRAM